MSEPHDEDEILPQEAPEAPQPEGEAAPGGPSAGGGVAAGPHSGARDAGEPGDGASRAPVKVVDRRFWARGETSAQAEEGSGGRRSPYPSVLEDLQQQLHESQARVRELLVRFRQAEQEREEFRQRLQRDVERRVSMTKAALFRDLLDVADNLERALAASGAGADAGSLARGVGQVLAQLQRLLAGEGVEEIPVAGLPFDPQVAEALEVREVPDAAQDGVVLEVTRRGYRLAGQTLRPAGVVVGRRRAGPGGEGAA